MFKKQSKVCGLIIPLNDLTIISLPKILHLLPNLIRIPINYGISYIRQP